MYAIRSYYASGKPQHPLRRISEGAACTWFLAEANPVTAWKAIGVTLLMATWWMLEALPIAVTALVPLA